MGVLYEETLVRLVDDGNLSIAAACGCVRRAYTSREASLAVTDLHTAAFLCRGLHFWSLSPFSPPEQVNDSSQQRLYATCGVSLVDLIPEVRI